MEISGMKTNEFFANNYPESDDSFSCIFETSSPMKYPILLPKRSSIEDKDQEKKKGGVNEQNKIIRLIP
jgi:hypothetical protein